MIKSRSLGAITVAALMTFAGMAIADEAKNAPAAAPSTQPAAVDLGNTKCAVTGEAIGDSKLTATYDGKIYHFCCEDCPATFKKDPAKYAKAVAADPAKYGVKSTK